MAVITGKAPGKIILFGEHAVVYGQPAIAIPVAKVKATAHVFPDFESRAGEIHIQALDIGLDTFLFELDPQHPLAAAVNLTLAELQLEHIPAFQVQISSNIPISAGMGSGAAISAAVIRGVSAFLGRPLPDSTVSALTYEVERIHHGNPSGIDNNVITYNKPVYYQKDQALQFLQIEKETHWVIGDTGEKTPTLETVSDLGTRHADKPHYYDQIFQTIGVIAQKARRALIEADIKTLGSLLNENQALLSELDLSCTSLDSLIKAALDAGAQGAKLSGGGRGGNMIALASPTKMDAVEKALYDVGAVNVISTKLAREPQS
ncbi:MAG: mevalonate kinase [Brevefilum sp.]|nr:mevalonate kinase [Brevefilum sp.]